MAWTINCNNISWLSELCDLALQGYGTSDNPDDDAIIQCYDLDVHISPRGVVHGWAELLARCCPNIQAEWLANPHLYMMVRLGGGGWEICTVNIKVDNMHRDLYPTPPRAHLFYNTILC